MSRERKRNKIIIIASAFILCLMGVGYAAFQTQLDIKGTSSIDSKWDIRITNVTESNKGGEGESAKAPSWTELTANMEANLYNKGDYVEYEVTIENKGTFDASLSDVITNVKSNNEAVKITFSGYTKGETLYKNTQKVIKVKIEYNPEYEGDASGTSGEVEVEFTYDQAEGGTVTPTDKYLISYDCTTNGGSDCTNYNEYLAEGSSVNLTYQGTEKEYYDFVGWNTESTATEGLTDLTVGANDITLYAIYKEKDPTGPIIDMVSTSTTTSTITVVVSAHDDESGIVKYEFSNDGGKTWTDNNESNTYTFTGLNTGREYDIKVKVTNGVNKNTESETIKVTTNVLEKPTFAEQETNAGKDITITYPEGCGDSLICTFIKDGEETEVTENTVIVSFTSSGNLIATVSDGTNEVSNTYTVTVPAIIQSWTNDSSSDFHAAEYRENIITATFVNNIDVPEDAISWDVSEKQNGSVMAWVIPDETNPSQYHLYIGGIGGVIANADSSYLFYNFPALTEINFNNNFDTSDATTMQQMFNGCTSLTNLNVSSFDTANVTNMAYMFGNTALTALDLSNFDTGKVTTMRGMFSDNSALTEIDISNFNTENVTTMENMFANFSSTSQLKTIKLGNLDTSKVENMSNMFNGNNHLTSLDANNLDTDSVTNMVSMFYGCSSLTSLDLSSWNTENVTSMVNMFNECSGLTSLNINGFDTSKVTNMNSMFRNCSGLTNLNVSSFDTANVTSMGDMFAGCSGLNSLNVSNFNTSKVTNMTGMFYGCSALTELNLNNFNTNKVTDMRNMFNGCTNLQKLDLSSFDTSNVTNMLQMFRDCSSLTKLSLCSFDTNRVTNMTGMFYYTSNLTAVYVGPNWTMDNADTTNMFNGSKASSVTQSDTCEATAEGLTLSLSTTSASSSITVIASATADSGIKKYEYRIDNGDWITSGSNTYTFTGLTQNTDHTIDARVTSGSENQVTETTTAKTTSIELPTFSESDTSTGKDVTITYPEGCGSKYTCTYIKDDEKEVEVNESTVSVPFDNAGTLVAKVTDGTNEMSSTYTVNLTAIIQSWDENANTDFHAAEYRENIITATFVNNKNIPEGVVSWDVSEKQNGSVMAWVVPDEDNPSKYHLYIGGTGGVIANENSGTLFANFTDLTEVNFGNNYDTSNVTNMYGMFGNCSSLQNLDLSSFDTSKVTNMSYMFAGCSGLNSLNLSNFDTSKVTNMSYMFAGCSGLNSLNLSNFNTSKVTNMSGMFYGCSALTELNLNNFDTSNVVDMSNMFAELDNLQTIDLSNFDTRSATNMDYMFGGSTGFTELDLSNFDTSKVTSMRNMFNGCINLQKLDLSSFDTRNVTDMLQMFRDCSSLTKIVLCSFDTSKVKNMVGMFYHASSLSKIYASTKFTVDQADITNIINGCPAEVIQSDTCEMDADELKISLSTSSTSNSITVFANATADSGIEKYEYRINNGNWVTGDSNTYNFTGLNQNTNYTIDVRVTSGIGGQKTETADVQTNSVPQPTFSENETSSGKDIAITYPEGCGSTYTCTYIKDDGTPETVTSTTETVSFTSSGNLIATVSDGINESSNVYNVEILPVMQSWSPSSTTDFHSSTYKSYITSAEVVDYKEVPSNAVDSWDVSENKDGSVMAWIIDDPDNSGYYKLYIGGDGGVKANSNSSYIFYGSNTSNNFSALETIDLTKLDTSNVTNMSYMFYYCSRLTSLDLSSFDTSNVTNMSFMFYNCSSLTNLDVSKFDTSNVTNMQWMFFSCSSLTELDLSNFDTSNVTNMSYMFNYCNSLTSITFGEKWDTSNVTSMQSMFYNCRSLASITFGEKWDTSNVTNMRYMFRDCRSLTSLDLSNFDTRNVTDMSSMFYYCSSLTSLDLSNFDTRNVTDMRYMFWNCSSLTSLDVSKFDTSNVTNFNNMFYNCSRLTNLDVSKFDTSNVTDMQSMFTGCSRLTNLDVSKFDTSNVTNMQSMFSGCSSLTSITFGEKWDTSNVTNMSFMFSSCSSLTTLDLHNWNTGKVRDMTAMFQTAPKLTVIYVGPNWTTANATTTSMFTSCGVSEVTQKS